MCTNTREAKEPNSDSLAWASGPRLGCHCEGVRQGEMRSGTDGQIYFSGTACSVEERLWAGVGLPRALWYMLK